mgnify:CR=1 FL=1
MSVMSRTLFCLILASLLAEGISHAAPPDAGTLLNEQRQPGSRLPDRLPKPDSPQIERAPLPDKGVKVMVKSFRFTGHDAIASEAELQALVSASAGRELTYAELQALAEKVTAFLKEKKGYMLAKAYLPEQDVTEGVIEIAIVAGRLDDNTEIRFKAPSRLRAKVLRDMIDKVVVPGKPLHTDDIERAMLLMNDLPGIKAQAAMEPGSTPGTTKVVINAAEGPLVTGSITADNQGDRYTGTWRGTGQASANDPFGLGDQLSMSLTGAENTFQGRVSYMLPLGSTGLNWSLSYTGLYYKLGGDMASLNYDGRADTISTSISYPILRSRTASIWGGLTFEYMMMTDEAGGEKIKDRKIPVGNASLTGTFFDSFGGGGMTSANVTLYGGGLDLSGVPASQLQDELGPRTSGGFFRATYSLARLQQLVKGLNFFASARGQLAGCNLDSSQKFILGGPSGVRAYPVGESSGDEGHAFTGELRLDLPFMPSWAATQLIGFIDTGWVKLHYSNWQGAVTSATGRNDSWLSGGGVGLNIGKEGLYSIRASYARTIDNNKGRSTTGKDSDNRSDKDRFWLLATVWF